MTTTTVNPAEPITRQFELRSAATDTERRELTGIAVPYGVPTELWPGWTEIVEPGAVEPADDMMLFRDHVTPIGKIIESRQTDAGFEITAKFSDTPAGNETLTLVRDGVLSKLSIRFRQIEYSDDHDEDGNVTRRHTRIEVSEVSVVPFPAYPTAVITEVRDRKENPVMPETTVDDLAEIRSQLADVRRDILALDTTAAPPAPDTRSAGEILKALVAGDADTIEAVNGVMDEARAWTGGTGTADAGTEGPAWARDLVRLIDNANPIAKLFATSPLPAEGMTVEYGQLKTNTLRVEKQNGEGADLAKGKVTVETKNAKVETFGGYTALSRQAIERSRVNLLDLSLRGMAIAAGKAAADNFVSVLQTTVKAQASNGLDLGKSLATMAWTDLVPLIIDGAAKYIDEGLSLDGLILTRDAFKAIAVLETKNGTPLMNLHGTGVNTIGQMDLTTPRGDVVNVTVYPDLRAEADTYGSNVAGTFFNTDAVRYYRSPLAQLQDENAVNLTKDFSVYFYAAVAPEIPAGLVPIKTTA